MRRGWDWLRYKERGARRRPGTGVVHPKRRRGDDDKCGESGYSLCWCFVINVGWQGVDSVVEEEKKKKRWRSTSLAVADPLHLYADALGLVLC